MTPQGALKPEPPAALRARVLESVAKSPARPRVVGPRMIAIAAGILASSLELVRAAVGGGGAATEAPLWVVVIPALTAIALSAIAVGGRRGMFGPPLGRVFVALLLAPLALTLSAFVAAHVAGPVVATAGHDGPVTHAGLGFGTLVLFALAALAPPRDPARPGWNGALLGAAAGTWLSLSCGFTCPVLALTHVLTWHLAWVPGLALVGAGLGWAYGRVWLRSNLRPF